MQSLFECHCYHNGNSNINDTEQPNYILGYMPLGYSVENMPAGQKPIEIWSKIRVFDKILTGCCRPDGAMKFSTDETDTKHYSTQKDVFTKHSSYIYAFRTRYLKKTKPGATVKNKHSWTLQLHTCTEWSASVYAYVKRKVFWSFWT